MADGRDETGSEERMGAPHSNWREYVWPLLRGRQCIGTGLLWVAADALGCAGTARTRGTREPAA